MHALLLTVLLAQTAVSPSPSASPTAVPPGGTMTVTPSSVELNPAQQRTIAIGAASAPLTATLDRKLVSVSVDSTGTQATITASQATGDDVLHLVDSTGARADVNIRVAFNAGTIVPQATLKVTGNPADPGWLATQAAAYVARLSQTLPGARATVVPPGAPPSPLAPGGTVRFDIPVTISSPDGAYFPASGTTTLDVQNVAVAPFTPELLFYDDDPEHITQNGVLFRGTVQPGHPASLYYYHDDTLEPHRLVVALTADSQEPTSVQVIDASAGPNIDVMQVGHTISRQFLHIEPLGEGTVIDLSPGQPYVLHDVPLEARQGAAGNVSLRVMAGGPVTATVLAMSPGGDVRTALGSPQLPGDGHHRTGVFRIAGFGNHALQYTVGGPDDKLVIGDTDPTPPSAGPNAAGHDYGDYGVLHSIDVQLRNPTDAPATAYLYFRPIGGIARSNFLVNGSLVQLGCVRRPIPYEIAALPLTAGQQTQATVLTMTDGGSFYPAEIGITATPPQPAAPPINAPDGCFPKP